ncbi:hypothetical protein CALVIDRAFT_527663 [Calocera viscosa TUFC12733]|uniref:Kinesin motor domain-containing protein n=1 Tax=Calocera viscosa (strain TUFC12733) TaxID=1330018 RepID=A0A167M1Q2_CALVF|nr:hypothetical protein CALVIDRAFT_527663 [Calocera viscosa TUFC12733]
MLGLRTEPSDMASSQVVPALKLAQPLSAIRRRSLQVLRAPESANPFPNPIIDYDLEVLGNKNHNLRNREAELAHQVFTLCIERDLLLQESREQVPSGLRVIGFICPSHRQAGGARCHFETQDHQGGHILLSLQSKEPDSRSGRTKQNEGRYLLDEIHAGDGNLEQLGGCRLSLTIRSMICDGKSTVILHYGPSRTGKSTLSARILDDALRKIFEQMTTTSSDGWQFDLLMVATEVYKGEIKDCLAGFPPDNGDDLIHIKGLPACVNEGRRRTADLTVADLAGVENIESAGTASDKIRANQTCILQKELLAFVQVCKARIIYRSQQQAISKFAKLHILHITSPVLQFVVHISPDEKLSTTRAVLELAKNHTSYTASATSTVTRRPSILRGVTVCCQHHLGKTTNAMTGRKRWSRYLSSQIMFDSLATCTSSKAGDPACVLKSLHFLRSWPVTGTTVLKPNIFSCHSDPEQEGHLRTCEHLCRVGKARKWIEAAPSAENGNEIPESEKQ